MRKVAEVRKRINGYGILNGARLSRPSRHQYDIAASGTDRALTGAMCELCRM